MGIDPTTISWPIVIATAALAVIILCVVSKVAYDFGRTDEAVKNDKQRTAYVALVRALGLYRKIEENSWDLTCVNSPTGGDDYDILWIVAEHYMAKPKIRQIGYGDTPEGAIKAALNKTKKPNGATD